MGCVANILSHLCNLLKNENNCSICQKCNLKVNMENHEGIEGDVYQDMADIMKKTKRKPKQIVSRPSVLHVQRATQGTLPRPQIMMEDGWSIYFGDEVGIISSNPTHIHIINLHDSDLGVAVKIDLFDCLLESMLLLKKFC